MTTPVDAYLAVLKGMQDKPKDFWKRVAVEIDDYGGMPADEDDLIRYLDTAGPNDPLRAELGLTVARWDSDTVSEWAASTTGGTDNRRSKIYKDLQIGDALRAWLSTNYPPHRDATIVIGAEDWQPWYDADRRRVRFYWDGYRRYLHTIKHWSGPALADLGTATDRIVERLADPTRAEAYQTKGLVVGHVQSGKTANFTGVVAKSIDAGYRQIIILTGVIELLRGQTQRRLDMEFVGVENLLEDRTVEEAGNDPSFEYGSDADWPEKFLRLGVDPRTVGQPPIVRYTGRAHDYRGLGSAATHFKPILSNPLLPPNAAENLGRTPVGVFVVKKNASVLRKLAADLKRVKIALQDIPVLIIDDESDQASVNTVNPAKVEQAREDGQDIAERTAINQAISDLLELMPRAQYVGYTATPFANVFINPDDAANLFPKDFVIGLEPPPGYMGAKEFATTNERDETVAEAPTKPDRIYIRDLRGTTAAARRAELAEALDMFVLTGAIKLYRQHVDATQDFRHHTMLIHESVRMADHEATAKLVADIWNTRGYASGTASKLLRKLYDDDVRPTSAGHPKGDARMPAFDELKPFIGRAVSRISEHANNPVTIVNGNNDLQRQQQQLNFDTGSVWRVLIGGSKLSRGFTVEGLTVTYYRRVAATHDTLAQAGRWFGFRPGYGDLVRVYIGRNEIRGSHIYDLREAFDAVVSDEQTFREQLAEYAVLVDGRPQIRPIDIPLLVSQHLFWLKPTPANKMYYAEIEEQQALEFGPVGYPLDDSDRSANWNLWAPVLDDLPSSGPIRLATSSRQGHFQARVGIADAPTIQKIIRDHSWLDFYKPRVIEPWRRFFDRVASEIDDFLVIAPQAQTDTPTASLSRGPLNTVKRQRRADRANVLGEPTEPKHRGAAERFVGEEPSADPALTQSRHPRRGAILVYLVAEGGPATAPTVAFRIYLPRSVRIENTPVIRFRGRISTLSSATVS